MDKNDSSVGTGLVGAPACGDVMKLQIKVDKNGKIIDAKFKTFGCGSAIASSSLATEWVKGKTVGIIMIKLFLWVLLHINFYTALLQAISDEGLVNIYVHNDNHFYLN